MKTKIIHNILTNEIKEVSLDEEELELHNKTAEEESKITDKLKKEAKAKEAARQSVLTKLGLTPEEAQALLGL